VSAGGVDLRVLPGALAVARLDPREEPPAWAAPAGALHSVVRTEHELSIVCPDDAVPAGVPAERGFRALAAAGPIDFSLTGVLASMAVPLAEAGVSIFALSTYDTDHLLVREQRLPEAVAALRAAGHRVRDGGR
jgi:hypothetical protein